MRHDLLNVEKRIRESRTEVRAVTGGDVIKFLDMKFVSTKDKDSVRSIIYHNVSNHWFFSLTSDFQHNIWLRQFTEFEHYSYG